MAAADGTCPGVASAAWPGQPPRRGQLVPGGPVPGSRHGARITRITHITLYRRRRQHRWLVAAVRRAGAGRIDGNALSLGQRRCAIAAATGPGPDRSGGPAMRVTPTLRPVYPVHPVRYRPASARTPARAPARVGPRPGPRRCGELSPGTIGSRDSPAVTRTQRHCALASTAGRRGCWPWAACLTWHGLRAGRGPRASRWHGVGVGRGVAGPTVARRGCLGTYGGTAWGLRTRRIPVLRRRRGPALCQLPPLRVGVGPVVRVGGVRNPVAGSLGVMFET